MKKILVLTGVGWNSAYQRQQRIANYISEQDCIVYYIGNIISSKFTFNALLKFFYRKIKNNKIIKNNKKNNNIKIVEKTFLNPELIFRKYNHFCVNKILKEIGYEFDVVINYLPIETTNYFLQKIQYKTLIYDCVRNFELWGGYPRDLKKIEFKLINASNYIFVDSFYLKEKIRKNFPNKKIIHILPTIDRQEFLTYMKYKKEPVKIEKIIYFGTIDNRNLDIDLLNNLSKEYKIILIGTIKGKLNFSSRIKIVPYISDLEKLAEVIMKNGDAIILPYSNKMDGVIPAKTIQVIASGLPIYIKEFYDSQKLSGYWYTYKDLNELKEKIKKYNIEEFKKNKIKKEYFVKEGFEEKRFKIIAEIIRGNQV